MTKENRNRQVHHHGHARHRRGPSSFWIQDPDAVFQQLSLKAGDAFLDLGCGPGEYATEAAKIIGHEGIVYALDKWEQMIDDLKERSAERGLMHIKAMVSDITEPLPIDDGCIDICLISTVLHTMNMAKDGKILFSEIRRVLKPSGTLAIIECKKEDQPFGPPKHMRLSPNALEDAITPYGYKMVEFVNFLYTYLICFSVRK